MQTGRKLGFERSISSGEKLPWGSVSRRKPLEERATPNSLKRSRRFPNRN